MKTLCLIDFSSRPDGNTHRIADFITEHMSTQYKVQHFPFSQMQVHGCGACAYECFKHRASCPYRYDDALNIYQAIMHSDLTLYIIPNYCDYPCSNFFLYNERSQCAFEQYVQDHHKWLMAPKKFIVISNTNTDNFTAILQYHVAQTPDILFLRCKDVPCRSLDGNLIEFESVQTKIITFLTQV